MFSKVCRVLLMVVPFFLFLWGMTAHAQEVIYCSRSNCVNFCGHHNGPSFEDHQNSHNLSSSSIASRPTVEQLDQQIKELQEMKRGYEARALRHEDLADQLQFDDKTYLETRRHNQLAAENRAKAAAVQKEIDRLEAEKASYK